MKNNLLKYYIAAVYFCSTFILFAQPGTDAETGAGEESLESVDPAPINDYVWVLVAVGILLVFLKYRSMYKQKAISKV